MPLSLADVLGPNTPSEFLNDYFGRNFLHVPGHPGKFSSLLPWTVLNRVLRTHRFVSPRLRLVHDGKSVPADLYLKNGYPRAAELTALLREGATLCLDAVDEFHEPLTALAEELERIFQVRIQVNMYAGWRVYHGFDVHWDSHDVIILQVAGRKHWKLYGITEKYPIKHSVALGKTPPTGDPVWEAMLTDGDALYIPRGCWHVAIPCDEPTLHLTVGIHTPTGLDLVKWMNEELERDDRLRVDLPITGDGEARAAYLKTLQTAVREAFDQPELLNRFLDSRNSMAPPRPAFGLPWSATPAVLPESLDAVITMVAARELELRPKDGNAIDVAFNGSIYTFAEPARVLFRFLNEELPATVGYFYQQFSSEFERETLQRFLSDLSKHGIIVVQEGPADVGRPASV